MGLSEEEARKKGVPIRCGRYVMDGNGQALRIILLPFCIRQIRLPSDKFLFVNLSEKLKLSVYIRNTAESGSGA